MLRPTLAAAAVLAAIAFFAAPPATADVSDLNNVDVVQSEEEPPAEPFIPGPDYATGDNISKPFRLKVDENCDPVRGFFTAEGFVEDPNGNVVYSDGKTLRSNGYKDGCNHC